MTGPIVVAICSRCENPARARQRLCLACHAANMRQWRKAHPMTEEQKFKDRARSYAAVYKRRGKLIAHPCRRCGAENAQMRHLDYNRPLLVDWLCRECRLQKAAAGHLPGGTVGGQVSADAKRPSS